RVREGGVVALALVLEAAHVVDDHDAERVGAGEFLLEVFAMSLDRRGQRPGVHAVGADTDRSTPAAGAEWQDLVEAVQQPGPLLLANEPFELRPIGSELRLGEPLFEVLERLLLDRAVHVDGTNAALGLCEQVHENSLANSAALRPRAKRKAGQGIVYRASSGGATGQRSALEPGSVPLFLPALARQPPRLHPAMVARPVREQTCPKRRSS